MTDLTNYRDLVQRRWYEHIVYTRNTILSLLSNGEDVPASVDRLLKNQEDIGNTLRPFYPADKVDEIVALLKDHIKQAGDIVVAAMAIQDTTDLIEKWRANCRDIVQKLTALNPDLAKTDLEKLWDDHLTLTINEVSYRQDKNWDSDILNFDRILDNIQQISDILADSMVPETVTDSKPHSQPKPEKTIKTRSKSMINPFYDYDYRYDYDCYDDLRRYRRHYDYCCDYRSYYDCCTPRAYGRRYSWY